ncbi:predicted protein [Thalassiosira pseudonana CCMP1335]|uniref:Uncharacterized protein n=1 Tax=Thalassiosira pseudonana TaxID=35128 RepID=B8LCL7_THAPS|nr:predicted protein [Thalassiosira pseudonana CCMP1335]EED87006.1 predicted protein [Thalassiosira pseudonana CCMP1335]
MSSIAPDPPSPSSSAQILKNLLVMHQWQAIATHIRANPYSAKVSHEFDGVKALPLHVACATGAPIGVIKALLTAYPKATQMKNDSGRLPLHCLFLNACPQSSIVAAIVESYPAAASVADGTGKFPIHHACERQGVTDEVFTTLLSMYPEGAYARDFNGMFPINYATSNKDVSAKKAALTALDRGTLYASISKMTSIRLLNDCENKLKAQLKHEKEKMQSLMQEKEIFQINKEEAIASVIQTEQVKYSNLEKELRENFAEVQLNNMDLVEQLDVVQTDLEKSQGKVDELSDDINELNAKFEECNARLDETNTTLASVKHLLEETQGKLASSRCNNDKKAEYILHLEQSLHHAQESVMMLAKEQEKFKFGLQSQREALSTLLKGWDENLSGVGGLMVDMIGLADDIGGVVKVKAVEVKSDV